MMMVICGGYGGDSIWCSDGGGYGEWWREVVVLLVSGGDGDK